MRAYKSDEEVVLLEGAIIGAVVGVAIALIKLYQQRKGGAKVMEAIRAGGPEARAALDGYVAPIYGKVSANKLLNTLERYSWLAILGDFDALESEAEAADGMLNVVTQLRLQAAAGLLAHRTEERDLRMMKDAHDRIHAEGGAMSALVKKIATQMVTLSQALQGGGIDPGVLEKVASRASQSGPATQAVLYRLLARVCQANNLDGAGYQAAAKQALDRLV